MMPILVMTFGDSNSGKMWPYTATLIVVPSIAVIGVVTLLISRPDAENAALVSQILGFGVTVTMATMAYLKSAETHNIVNSRMDEFKRELQVAADASIVAARVAGRVEGTESANARTDALLSKSAKAKP